MFKNKSFTYWIVLLPVIAIILTSSLLTYEFISNEKEKLKKEHKKITNAYIYDIQERIKNRINRIINLIETNNQLIKEEENNNIINIIDIGYKTIEDVYNTHKNASYENIIKEIRNRLENLRFYNNGSGYFFIIDLNNKVLMQPQSPSHRNTIQTQLKDLKGKYIIQSFTNIAKTKKEGFDSWYWYKKDSSKMKKKIGYIKTFEPLNLYIGTAKYEEDILKKIKKESLKLIDIVKFEKDEYIFAMDKEGTTLSHINKDFIGKKLSSLSGVEKEIVENILIKGKRQYGGFIHYIPTSYNIKENLSKKISYVKTIPSLDWIIGTGQYTTMLEKEIQYKKELLEEEVKETINKILLISAIISIILIIILVYIAKKLENRLLDYKNQLALKNKTLQKLNNTLEKKVEEQVRKNRQKDEILYQQSKHASMGEMIGNIAHQWRQPLSTISTAASGIKMQDELNILERNSMHYSLDAIIQNTSTLSETIDDFRNFFKKDKVRIFFHLENTINKVLNLLSSSLKNKDIQVIEDLKAIELNTLENELTQALLNIITNAKDALIDSKEDTKVIIIKTEEIEDNVFITITDNAGGISLDIINKIFDPYFTTKFKSQGTGIGLYMTRTIIENHMKSNIEVRNKNFEFEGKEYTGAEFKIVINKKSV